MKTKLLALIFVTALAGIGSASCMTLLLQDPIDQPSEEFDLSCWYLSIPQDRIGSSDETPDGKADSIKERVLNDGYTHEEFFYRADDGGLVFRCPIYAARTSSGTKYTRVELREMLRRGDTEISTKGVNKNNWVLSSSPDEDQVLAGGVDGKLAATLKIDHVTTSGDDYQVGRVIVGQIHANQDEPARLYYRRLPGHERGSIYLAHEPRGKKDQYTVLVGSREDDAEDPSDGIALGEVFSYEIRTQGNTLTVRLSRAGKPDIEKQVDMSESGYDEGGQYLYFKVGVYNQNSSGDEDDYVQATFYDFSATHE